MGLPDVVIAVASSSHRSYAISYHPASGVANAASGGSLNLYMHRSDAPANLRLLIGRLGKLSGGKCRVVGSFPGISTEEKNEEAKTLLAEAIQEIPGLEASEYFVTDDTQALLIAGRNDSRGIGAISGIGASAFCGMDYVVSPSSKPYKLDGFGPHLGDFGSSVWLAKDFFQSLTRTLDATDFQKTDSGNALAQITDALPSGSDLPLLSPMKLPEWFQERWESGEPKWLYDLSGVSKAILSVADNPLIEEFPDTLINPRRLVRRAALEMAETIARATSVSREDCPPVIAHGSMFRESELYRNVVFHALQSANYAQEFSLATRHPVLGCVGIGMSEAWPHRNKIWVPIDDSHFYAISELISTEIREQLFFPSVELSRSGGQIS